MSTTKLTKAATTPTLADATDMIWHKTIIHVYPVTDSQLEEITAGYNSLHLVFFGACIGATISLWIAFGQSVSTTSERPYYFAAALATLGLAIVFGINGVSSYLKASIRKKQLYKESIPIEK